MKDTGIPPVNGWPGGLRGLLDGIAGELGVVEVRNDAVLDGVLQTGFAHTRRDGVICLAMNRDYLARASDNPCARAVIMPPPVAGAGVPASDKAWVVCRRAEELYLYLHARQLPDCDGDVLDVDPSASVDASALLRGRVRIAAGARIGPRVVVSGPVTIGAGAWIDAGAIVGCDGLYAKTIRGHRVHVPHFGGVEIDVDACIHAGAIVARSALRGEATRIGSGAHIGIAANVGHDAQIGDGATLSSHCVIAGRACVGTGAWIGASATVSNAIHVGDRARVRLGAVVIRDVPDGASVSGNFALDHARSLRRYLEETAR